MVTAKFNPIENKYSQITKEKKELEESTHNGIPKSIQLLTTTKTKSEILPEESALKAMNETEDKPNCLYKSHNQTNKPNPQNTVLTTSNQILHR